MSRQLIIQKLSESSVKKLEEAIQMHIMQYTTHMMMSNTENKFQLFSISTKPAIRAVIECVMLITRGNQSESARILGISRGTLRIYLKKMFGRCDIGVVSANLLDVEDVDGHPKSILIKKK